MHAALPSVQIKVMNRGNHLYIQFIHSIHSNYCLVCLYWTDGRSQIESQLAVSMEINGIVYHGTLFAQSARSRHS